MTKKVETENEQIIDDKLQVLEEETSPKKRKTHKNEKVVVEEKLENNGNNDTTKNLDEEDSSVLMQSFFSKKTERQVNKLKRKKTFSYENASRYKPKADKGLNIQEVQERIENGYVNLVHDKNKKTYLHFTTPTVSKNDPEKYFLRFFLNLFRCLKIKNRFDNFFNVSSWLNIIYNIVHCFVGHWSFV